MQYSAVLSLLILSPIVLADFLIFTGQANILDEGGSGTATAAYLFNNPPSCDDLYNKAGPVYQNSDNDATESGLACDGCDNSKSTPDWVIERFELDYDDSPWGDGTPAHITMYRNDADGTYNLVDTDNVSYGSCFRPESPQELQCSSAFESDDLYNLISCTTALTLTNSN